MYEGLTALRMQIDGHVAVLTIDAPPVNALTKTLSDELTM
jgi:enoyl-CoA hydratase